MSDRKIRIAGAPGRETLPLVLLAAVVILIYSSTLTSPYIFDDLSNIRQNPHIRIPYPSVENLAWAAFQSPLSNRPVANISFALNYFIHGYNLVGFHVVNILIHIACGIFLYYFVKATIHTPGLQKRYGSLGWIPFFTAFIWLVHPLQTQSVTYLVQRMNSLAAMFYILSMLLYVEFRRQPDRRLKWPLLGGCVLAGILAFGTKEITITLPGFILLYEWYFFQGLSWQWIRRHLPILTGFVLLIVILAFFYFENEPLAQILNSYNKRDFTMLQRVLTQYRVVLFYISLLIWPNPTRLSLDHDFALSYSLTNPVTTLLSLAVIMALLVAAILIAKREPLISFGILWFLGNLFIESSIIGLELVFEHRNYLPSMLVIFCFTALAFRVFGSARYGAVALCLVGILFTAWTFERNKVWSDEITLYRDCVNKAPAKARPYNNLGAALMRAGQLAQAVRQFNAALDIKPDFVDARYNLGSALARQGKLEAGIYQFGEVLRLEPKNLKALNNMGVAQALLDRHEEAVRYFEKALKLNPKDPDLLNNLGYSLNQAGHSETARQHLNRALALNPRHAGVHNNLGLILLDSGQYEAAARHFARALEIDPFLTKARRNLERSRGRGQKIEVGSGNAEVGNH
ncbi:MAG: tetratricopeptide repeat protein [Desulfobacterales bacterium]|nr:tetratricopeptide repeat protein [Desulfobacterales bacterium]